MRERPLRVLMMLTYYVPHRTGLPLHVQTVAEELVRRGHQVTVLTARYSSELPRDESIHNGVRVVRLWAPLRFSRTMILPAYPWAAWKLIAEHDVVSIHTPMVECALAGLICQWQRKPLLITHHGDLILPAGWYNRDIERISFKYYSIAARRASRNIGYSHDYADHSYYLKAFRDKVSVVYPPINIPPPQPEAARALRDEWAPEGGPIIGYSGRFVQEKRPDVAIRALETICARYPNARLVLAGEYLIPYEDFFERNRELVERFRDKLVFLGLLKDAQSMANFYRACDVLTLPSDTECFGMVQVEAMLCGTPVVITDIPGGREVVRVTGMGEIVPMGDHEALGRAVIKVLAEPGRYRRERAEIERSFSLTETVDRYERLLRGG